MIETGSDIQVHDVNDNQIAILGFGDGSITPEAKWNKELMTKNEVHIFFNYPELAEGYFKRGCYIDTDLKEGRFHLRTEPTKPSYNATTGGFQYELIFEAFEMLWQDCIMFYTYQGLKETGWNLTGTPAQHVQIAVDSINDQFGTDWTIGEIPDMSPTLISYDSQNAFDGLTDIAETFGLEWYADYENKTINFVSSYEFGDYIQLKREEELSEITVSNENSEEYCTRLIVFGSTRNIPSNYRSTGSGEIVDAIVQKRLRMPIATGDHLDAFPNMKPSQIDPHVKNFDDIYPKRIGTITSIRSIVTKNDDGVEMTVFFFKDSGLAFSEDYLMPGLNLSLHFESGFLWGKDLELKYHPDTEEFEIQNDQDNPDLIVPNDILCPKAGDQYVLYNFNIELVGNQYIPEAEAELKAKAEEYFTSVLEDNATYTCTMNPYRLAEYGLDLDMGQRVKLVTLMLRNGYKNSRIRGFEKVLDTPITTYIVGDKPVYKRLKNIEKTVETNKEIADMQYLEAMKAVKNTARTVKGMQYLRTALENETVIDKGLLLTTLLRLGAMMGTEWVEVAGINGAAVNEDDVVAYFGGSLDDAILGIAAIVFRMDGSGHLAKGNISWDKDGNPVFNGVTTSVDADGNKILIDANNRSIRLINKNGFVFGEFGYDVKDEGDLEAMIELRSIYEGETTRRLTISPLGGISSRSPDGTLLWTINQSTIKYNIGAIATSREGIDVGMLYRDGESLNIKATE